MSKERIEELKDHIAIEQGELRAMIKYHKYDIAVAVASQLLNYTEQLNELSKAQSQEVVQ